VLASRIHARDRRQREPYCNHLLRVMIRILSHYRVTGRRLRRPAARCRRRSRRRHRARRDSTGRIRGTGYAVRRTHR
jgi:hypothetical protein